MHFTILRKYPYISISLRNCFKRCWHIYIFIAYLSVPMEIIKWVLCGFINIINCVNMFMLKQSCITGISHISLWIIITLLYCWIQFAIIWKFSIDTYVNIVCIFCICRFFCLKIIPFPVLKQREMWNLSFLCSNLSRTGPFCFIKW